MPRGLPASGLEARLNREWTPHPSCVRSHKNGGPRSAQSDCSPLRARRLQREGRWPGVRSPAHARGAPDVVHGAQFHQRQPSTPRARTPRMGPAPVPRATRPGPRGGTPAHRPPPWLQQGGGGAPGRRSHSRCPGSSCAWTMMTRPAVVGLGGAPRAWAGERGRRHRPGAQSLGGWACADRQDSLEAPGHLPPRWNWHARSGER